MRRTTNNVLTPQSQPRTTAAKGKSTRTRTAPSKTQKLVTSFDETRVRALACVAAALDKKAEDILVYDLRGLCNFTDVFVLCTGGSTLQVRAIADNIVENLRAQGARSPLVDGLETKTWAVVDFGDVVVHIMSPDAREFYNLEGLWGDAPEMSATG